MNWDISKKNLKDKKGEVLIAILKDKLDFAILQEQGWYRIPVRHAPRRWPPRWLAFYQPKAFGDDAYRVRYYGEVADIQVARRSELFPDEFPSAKSDQKYYRISLKRLEERHAPIISTRPRRLVFIPTTWRKFSNAEWINDLFDDSPLEDRLWKELNKLEIDAERQWRVYLKQRFYLLDFALFCDDGPIDIETDGDTWHASKERIPLDNQRDNDLVSSGWRVLRFNGKQIIDQMRANCLGKIQQTINRLGGLSEEGLVPRIFYSSPGGTVQQLSLFEKPGRNYIIEEAKPFEVD
jgi:very-short-patch-repair endonuclease